MYITGSGGSTPVQDEDGRATPVMDEMEGGGTPTQDEGGCTPVQDEGGCTPVQDEGGFTPVQDEGRLTPVQDEPPTYDMRASPQVITLLKGQIKQNKNTGHFSQKNV